MHLFVAFLLVLALVLFGLAAWPLPAEPLRGRFVAAGLFCLTLAYLVTHSPLK